MTSDVVRWFRLSSQQSPSQQRDVMTSPGKLQMSNRSNSSTLQNEDSQNTHRSSSIAATIQAHLNITALLFIWLVINQNVSLVLSDPILATSNLTIDVKNPNGDDRILPPNDDLLAANSVSLRDDDTQLSNDIDLPSQFQAHHIISDDDILNDKHFTPTWALHIPGGDEVAKGVADEHGFTYLGKVSSQFNHPTTFFSAWINGTLSSCRMTNRENCRKSVIPIKSEDFLKDSIFID